jgi:hypothetical protein
MIVFSVLYQDLLPFKASYKDLQRSIYNQIRDIETFIEWYHKDSSQLKCANNNPFCYYPLTDENKRTIHKNGADIYLKLVEARRLKSLPAFDNSPLPAFMKDYYRYINEYSIYMISG